MKAFIAVSVVLLSMALQLCHCKEKYYVTRFMVQVDGDRKMADRVARAHGMRNMGQVGGLKDVFVMEMGKNSKPERVSADNLVKWAEMDSALKKDPHVVYFEPDMVIPTKPHFYTPPSDPLWPNQWSLSNTGSVYSQYAGNDVRAEKAWLQGVTGCGTIVTVTDEGLDYTHSDIAASYLPDTSFDLCDDDPDPFIASNSEDHGTAVAGEIVGARSNGQCGTGIAYNAQIGNLRFLGSNCVPVTINTFITAETYRNDIVQIYSNSWGFVGEGDAVVSLGSVWSMALQDAMTVRNGRGSVLLFSSGNDGDLDDDCSSTSLCTSIYTNCIGSAAVDGRQAFYDEKCSSKMAVTFVSGSGIGSIDVVTTIPSQQCTQSFDGTSAACPIAAAIVALTLEVNPDLTWRDVQYLIAYTSSHELLTPRGTTNGAGLEVSHEFGHGAMDAEAMVSRARHWVLVPTQQSDVIDRQNVFGSAQQGNPFVTTFTYTGSLVYLEHVTILTTVGVTSGNRGDLRVELTSPSSTTSVLMDYRDNDLGPGSYSNYEFMSVHFWGENPNGVWTLTVRSRGPTVDISGYSPTFYGTHEIPEAIQNIPNECDAACDNTKGCANSGPQYCDACASPLIRDSHTLQCVNSCPDGYVTLNGYCFDPSQPTPTCETQDTQGSCVDQGYTSCCQSGDCRGTLSFPDCYCDELCHRVGDCCPDIADVNCLDPGSANTLTYFSLSSPIFLPSVLDGFSEISMLDGFPFASLSFSSIFINTNGIISMGSSFTEYIPELFPINDRYLVAPFWADVDIQGGVGSIGYQIYTSGSSEIDVINSFITSEEGFSFTACWMLVAEWDHVSTFGGPTSETNTYQAVLATDGTNSFALFIYNCGDLQWSGGATIGYGASNEAFFNNRLSGTARATEIACLNNPDNQFTTLVFELTDSRGEESGTCPGAPDPSDDTLEFINDTPYADGTTVRIELSVGEAYTSLDCSIIEDDAIISTQECLDGTAFFEGLRVNERQNTILVEGMLINGNTHSISRTFATDESRHCLVHFINEITTVSGVTSIHWQRTGPGDEADIRCKIRGVSRFTDCENPMEYSDLESGVEYAMVFIQDRQRIYCNNRRRSVIRFTAPTSNEEF